MEYIGVILYYSLSLCLPNTYLCECTDNVSGREGWNYSFLANSEDEKMPYTICSISGWFGGSLGFFPSFCSHFILMIIQWLCISVQEL